MLTHTNGLHDRLTDRRDGFAAIPTIVAVSMHDDCAAATPLVGEDFQCSWS
jgi:hypothetical protein